MPITYEVSGAIIQVEKSRLSRVIDAETSAVVLESACYQYTVSQ